MHSTLAFFLSSKVWNAMGSVGFLTVHGSVGFQWWPITCSTRRKYLFSEVRDCPLQMKLLYLWSLARVLVSEPSTLDHLKDSLLKRSSSIPSRWDQVTVLNGCKLWVPCKREFTKGKPLVVLCRFLYVQKDLGSASSSQTFLRVQFDNSLLQRAFYSFCMTFGAFDETHFRGTLYWFRIQKYTGGKASWAVWYEYA